MKFPRASGVLLHPTSLPGEYGIGDLGPEAYSFINFLEDTAQTYWQILPLGPTGYGDSPYNCFSAFAGNTLLISPEKLIVDGLLTKDQIEAPPTAPPPRVDFGAVHEWKNVRLLPKAYRTFISSSNELTGHFDRFVWENDWWLADYAAYRAIKLDQGQRPWYEWPTPLKLREPGAIAAMADQLADSIRAQKFYQFLFFRQWSELKEYANKRGISIIGDVPIFLALDSADVWCNQSKFKLKADGSPKVVSGVPPDFFSKTGQLWGNPIYDWDAMRREGFDWWTARVAFALRTVDVMRIDHFRGFAAAWEVPGGEPTAENGSWVDGPGKELFKAFSDTLGDLPMIAEDLGVITPDVEDLRDSSGIPGMRILQFGFGGDAHNLHLPHNYIPNCVAYTGTHDNDTTLGWWNSLSSPKSKELSQAQRHCLEYLDIDSKEINWDLIRSVWSSVADTAIAPLQDILGVGTTGRMNLPATTSANWSWRFESGSITEEIVERLKKLTTLYGRDRNQ
ncbi:MAG TPA: 4-alpha-glucanotransferase [Pyrinomonadaceae bacterium]|nr:4-alpha-glucanotransferase [Pyrinomonadaceae bacterium]